MKCRIKKVCGKCVHVADFPYIHCSIGCKQSNDLANGFIVSRPADQQECKEKRQAFFIFQ
jgi:hypothetical protein